MAAPLPPSQSVAASVRLARTAEAFAVEAVSGRPRSADDTATYCVAALRCALWELRG